MDNNNRANIIGALIGLFFIIIYLFICYKYKVKPDLAAIIAIIASCVGFVYGVQLMYLTFYNGFSETGFFLQLIMGGIALCYISGDAIWNIFNAIS